MVLFFFIIILALELGPIDLFIQFLQTNKKETTKQRKKENINDVKNISTQCIPENTYPTVVTVPKCRGSRAIYCFNCYTTNNNVGNIQNIGFTPNVFVQCLRNTTGIADR